MCCRAAIALRRCRSSRAAEVEAACAKYGMTLASTGLRLFRREFHWRVTASTSDRKARLRYISALTGDLLGVPRKRCRIATGTWLTL
jgi:hypothetical protein